MTPAEAETMKAKFRERVTNFAWPARKEIVKVDFGDGGGTVEVEVRQPTVDQRAKILAAAGMMAEDAAKRDMGKLMANAVVHCCYFPGTNVPVVDSVDLPRMLASPAGGWVDTLGGVAVRLMNVEAPAAAKKSEPTESSNSSV